MSYIIYKLEYEIQQLDYNGDASYRVRHTSNGLLCAICCMNGNHTFVVLCKMKRGIMWHMSSIIYYCLGKGQTVIKE